MQNTVIHVFVTYATVYCIRDTYDIKKGGRGDSLHKKIFRKNRTTCISTKEEAVLIKLKQMPNVSDTMIKAAS